MLVPMAAAVHAEERIEYFVDANAADAGDGSLAKPFSSIVEARDAVRELKKNKAYPSGGVTVTIRGGNYAVSESVAFGAEDSGEEGAPVVYRAYPLEEVNIVGAQKSCWATAKRRKTEILPTPQREKSIHTICVTTMSRHTTGCMSRVTANGICMQVIPMT